MIGPRLVQPAYLCRLVGFTSSKFRHIYSTLVQAVAKITSACLPSSSIQAVPGETGCLPEVIAVLLNNRIATAMKCPL